MPCFTSVTGSFRSVRQ